MNEKKLVYILNYVHPLDSQHFVHVLKLLHILEQMHDWEITVLSEKGGRGVARVNDKVIHYLSRKGKIIRLIMLLAMLVKYRFRGYRLIFVRISRPAAIVSSIFGKFLGMKCLYWQSSAVYDLDREKPVLRRVFDDISMSLIVLFSYRFVTAPEYMLRYYERNLHVPKKKLMLLYNDIDIQRFYPKPNSHENGKPLKILFVHRFSPARNATLYFPSILQKLNEFVEHKAQTVELDLIGDGPLRLMIEDQLKSASTRVCVRLLGALPNVDLPNYYRSADIFIMPSYREGMPRSLMEAMASGLPIVSTDAGGTRDIVGQLQQEYVVSRDDPLFFASRLVDMLADDIARQLIGKENREHVKRYSSPRVADMYNRALSELL